jgi:RNA polymerase sigma-70 factor (ECF subfamily)
MAQDPLAEHSSVTQGQVTVLLRAYEAGDRSALGRLVPLVYDELRRIARIHVRRRSGHSLDTTALVNEAYLKLARAEGLRVEDRGHFMAVAALAMKQVILSRARARATAKRGDGKAPVQLDEALVGVERQADWLLDLDRALELLRERDEKLARIVECRFFAGMSEEETAEALDQSLRTVQRGWMRARAWLRAELQQPAAGGS